MAYYGALGGLLAVGSPLLPTRFRRILFGLCSGLIAATLLPFIRAYFGW